MPEKRENGMKKHLSTLLLAAVFLLGVCIMLYPTASDYWNSLHQTRAIGAYEDALAGIGSPCGSTA